VKARAEARAGVKAARPAAARPSPSLPAAPSAPPVPTPSARRELRPALFGVALVAADALALALGPVAAYVLRFRVGLLPVPLGTPPLGPYVAALPLVIGLGLFVFQQIGLYHRRRVGGLLRDVLQGAKGVALLSVLLAAIAFFYRDFSFSRTFLVLNATATGILFVAGRQGAAAVHRALRARDIGVERVAIAGEGEVADRLATRIAAGAGSGMRLVARLTADDWADPAAESGALALRPLRVRSLLRTNRLDRLIIADASLSSDERLELVEICQGEGARCDFVPDLFEVMLGRARLDEIGGVPLVGSRLHPLGRIDRVQKRTLDIVGSALGLVVLSPLLAFTALLVKLDSRGGALYRQRRLGRDGREFDLWKFRSMPIGAETGSGPVRNTKGDTRATRLGRVLRRTSVDELPQLWNVLRGEMSLVGPRPERPFFVESFRERIPRYLERHGVKSGLTGWAQVNGLRGDSSIEDRTRFDIWYVENWTLALDLKILLLTALRFLFQEEAY
jgi:exopolysaccharide biosynthesis polyprenyl glycosylphosphotransferase